jgi:cytochrome c oxidase subunit III
MASQSIPNQPISPELRAKNSRLLLYISIGSMVMVFAGLTSAYIVSKAKTDWLIFDLPYYFWFSTAVILTSSLTMSQAIKKIKADDVPGSAQMVLITLTLGMVFFIFQFMGWNELVNQKIFFAGKDSNMAGSYVYVLTGLHLAHLIGGLIALATVYFRAKAGRYSSANFLGMSLCSTYWHFLDILWIYLFLFLLFAR